MLYPILVKIINCEAYVDEDENGCLVQYWKNPQSQYAIITSDDEYADLTERCATSEGGMTMQAIASIPYEDMEDIVHTLLFALNFKHHRKTLTCPFCDADFYTRTFEDCEYNRISELCVCENCNNFWTNYYTLYNREFN